VRTAMYQSYSRHLLKALLRLYQGSVKALLRLYSGDIARYSRHLRMRTHTS
jgi:hypothetical protein